MRRADDHPETWTLGPEYAVAICTRCGASLQASDVVTGWCYRCGNMGVVEFKDAVRPS